MSTYENGKGGKKRYGSIQLKKLTRINLSLEFAR